MSDNNFHTRGTRLTGAGGGGNRRRKRGVFPPSPGRVKLGRVAQRGPAFFLPPDGSRSPRQYQRCIGVPTPDGSHREGGLSGTRPPSLWADMLSNGASGNRRDYAGMNQTGNASSSCRRILGRVDKVGAGGRKFPPASSCQRRRPRSISKGGSEGLWMPLRPCGGGRGGVTCPTDRRRLWDRRAGRCRHSDRPRNRMARPASTP